LAIFLALYEERSRKKAPGRGFMPLGGNLYKMLFQNLFINTDKCSQGARIGGNTEGHYFCLLVSHHRAKFYPSACPGKPIYAANIEPTRFHGDDIS